MGKSVGSSSANHDPSDNKHEQKLQAVVLADTFSDAFHPITLEPYRPGDDAAGARGHERPLLLCPLNNVPLLHHTLDFLQGSGVEELFLLCSSGADALEDYLRRFGAEEDGRRSGEGGGGGSRIVWSSKLTVRTLRFADCTNAGDALRELDRRNVIKSDPFVLMQGDVVTNVDLREAMAGHRARRKKDAAAIMTVVLQEVGGWGLEDDQDGEGEAGGVDEEAARSDNPNAPHDANHGTSWRRRHNHGDRLPPLRSSADDLLLALDTTHANRILLWDSHPARAAAAVPVAFFRDNSSRITLTRDHLDAGLDLCSPDVLARFSDEFDYRELRGQFVANAVAEEEAGLQSQVFAHVAKRGEYCGRVGDPRRYHRTSLDLLRRWCYPRVPDNYGRSRGRGGGDGARYVVERHLVYRDVGVAARHGSNQNMRSHVGRSTQLLGPLLLGPNNSIGERCTLQRSVLGPNCTVMDRSSVVDSHLWGNVLVEEGAQLHGVIVCEGAIVKKGAIVETGCVIGRGCVVGEGVHLREFTRITCAAEEAEDEDDYSGFDDSSPGSEEESTSSEEGGHASSDCGEDAEGDGNEGSSETIGPRTVDLGAPELTSAPPSSSAIDSGALTNHAVVGIDGLGRVYVPSLPDGFDSDDDDSEGDAAQAAATELMKSQSIGYDMRLIYQKWKRWQAEEEDDGFSLEEGTDSEVDLSDDVDMMDDEWTADNVMGNGAGIGGRNDETMRTTDHHHLDEEGMQIAGRQKGVDVVKELRDICLEHETTSPVENLRIELNSFKFSQNATYADCCKGAMMAVMEKILEEPKELADGSILAPGKLVASLKKTLEYWGTLFQSLCIGPKEEKAIIHSLETMALGSSGNSKAKAPNVLGKEPAFRFVLQTLHDREIVNEEAIFEWASERKEEGRDSPMGALFWQQPTQDFLEWLEEDSSDSGSSNKDDDSD